MPLAEIAPAWVLVDRFDHAVAGAAVARFAVLWAKRRRPLARTASLDLRTCQLP